MRRELKETEKTLPHYEFPHWEVEPWHESMDTAHDAAQLLRDIVARIKRHNVMSDHQALTVALWILFAWCHGTATHSPVLLVTSPEFGSGKTQLLSLLSFLAPRGYHAVDPTPAAIYQSIDRDCPTLCIDDADTAFVGANKLRALINGSWTRSSAKKKIGTSHGAARWYSLWCPKAFGMIGRRMEPSTLSRCIVIEMQRKLPDELIEGFEGVDDDELKLLRCKAMRFAADNLEALKSARPDFPVKMFRDPEDRFSKNWRMLLAIADMAGGKWGSSARKAAVAIGSAFADEDDQSKGIRLLAAIKVIRVDGAKHIVTADLVAKLAAHDDCWAKVTAAQISDLLRPHKIRPVNIRVSKQQVLKGYRFADFDDPTRRYVG
jgi:hypothetical protein